MSDLDRRILADHNAQGLTASSNESWHERFLHLQTKQNNKPKISFFHEQYLQRSPAGDQSAGSRILHNCGGSNPMPDKVRVVAPSQYSHLSNSLLAASAEQQSHRQFGNQNANTNFYARILGAMPPLNPYERTTEGFPVETSAVTENRTYNDLLMKNSAGNTPFFMQRQQEQPKVESLSDVFQRQNASLSMSEQMSRIRHNQLNFSIECAPPGRSISLPKPLKETKHKSQEAGFLLQRNFESEAAPPVTVVLEGRSICQRICLQEHANYATFAQALRVMFTDIIPGEIHAGVCNLANAIPGHVIAYEDIEGDLLLAGDLSWKDFVRVAKRIRILPAKNPAGDRRLRG